MSEKILVIRMQGVADALAIGVPALRYIRQQFPKATIHCLTYGQGQSLINLAEPEVKCMCLPEQSWPNDIIKAMEVFLGLAEQIVPESYDQIINLDTAFMPCFLARFLKDAGEPVSGNFINQSVQDLLDALNTQQLDPAYVQGESNYMESSFFTMSAWFSAWWLSETPDLGYPEYYLARCCGFNPLSFDMSVNIEPDSDIDKMRQPVVALCLQESDDGYLYPFISELASGLKQNGFACWQQTPQDSAVSLIAKLKASQLVVTKSAAIRWYAQAVGTKVLLISGAIEPRMLMPDYATDTATPSLSQTTNIHLSGNLGDSAGDLVESISDLLKQKLH